MRLTAAALGRSTAYDAMFTAPLKAAFCCKRSEDDRKPPFNTRGSASPDLRTSTTTHRSPMQLVSTTGCCNVASRRCCSLQGGEGMGRWCNRCGPSAQI